MKRRHTVLAVSLLSLMIACFVGELATGYYGMIRSGHGLSRVRMVDAVEFSTIKTQIFGIDEELRRLNAEVSPLTDKMTDDLQKALAVKEYVMNQVKRTDKDGDLDRSKRTPYTILMALREGKTGASCAFRALLYLGALKSIGMEARMVTLIASDVASDPTHTHATVEVLINDKWVVVDPRFNVYFTINGQLASAVELHQLLQGNTEDVVAVRGRKVPSEIPFDSLDYLLDYYHNVSIYERRHFFVWQALPILQYFFGVSDVYLEGSSIINDKIVQARNFTVLAYNFLFPLGFAFSLAALLLTSRHKLR